MLPRHLSEPRRIMSQPPASPQGQRLTHWATMLAGISLVLVVVNIVLAILDQNAQADVNQRQQQIAQAAQLEAVTNVLARELQAQAPNDPQIQDLLKRVQLPVAGTAVPPPAAAPAARARADPVRRRRARAPRAPRRSASN